MKSLQRKRAFIVFATILLLTTMVTQSMAGTSTSQQSDDARIIDIKKTQQDQESIEWEITFNKSEVENEGAIIHLELGDGLTKSSIASNLDAEITETDEGYGVSTSTGSNSYKIDLTTKVSEKHDFYELRAMVTVDDIQYEAYEKVEKMESPKESTPEERIEQEKQIVQDEENGANEKDVNSDSNHLEPNAGQDVKQEKDDDTSGLIASFATLNVDNEHEIELFTDNDDIKLSFEATRLIKKQKYVFKWIHNDVVLQQNKAIEAKEDKEDNNIPKASDEFIITPELITSVLNDEVVTIQLEITPEKETEPVIVKQITLVKEEIKRLTTIIEITSELFPNPKEVHPDLLYYGNVARDERVPFSNKDELWDILIEKHDEGGVEAAQTFFNKYKWDLYNAGDNNIAGDYGDDRLQWPKDSTSPFHYEYNGQPTIKNLATPIVDYEDIFTEENLKKNVTPYTCTPGDSEADRKYKVNISATADPSAQQPIVMLFQVQTSWQMFDLHHANALVGEGANTQKGRASHNTGLGNLYDIKQAFLRFAEYADEKKGEVPIVFALTNVQHGDGHNFLGDKGPYLTNDMNMFTNALVDWDSFGDCEHIHYETSAIDRAIKAIPTELNGWEDSLGNLVDLERVRKTAVIIGGPTENDSGRNGYGADLSSSKSITDMDAVYGIRTNSGVSEAKGFDGISWLDQPFNQELFNNYYPDSTNEDLIYQALVDIVDNEIKAAEENHGTNSSIKVNNIVLEDIVEKEFKVVEESIKIAVTPENGSEQLIDPDPERLNIVKNSDGTTTVQYIFDEMGSRDTARIVFDIEANKNYLGSNDVFTNVGVPKLEYTAPDGVDYEKNYTNKPQVHVPIRFEVKDGETIRVDQNEEVNLKDLSTEIVKDIEEKKTKYPQINGKVVYQWQQKDEDGEFVDVGNQQIFEVNSGTTDAYFDLDHYFSTDKKGKHIFRLKVSFIPNQPEDEECKAVELVKYGEVNVIIGDDYVEPGDVLLNKVGIPTDKYDEWKVELMIKGEDLIPTSDIVLVLDISSSMSKNKRFENMLKSAENLVETVMNDNPNVRIGLVEFDSSPNKRLDFSNDKKTVLNSIKTMKMGSGTNIQGGIYYGRQLLDQSDAGYKTMILLSDGSPNRSYKASKASSYSWPNDRYGFTLSDFDYTKIDRSQDYRVDGYRVRDHSIGTISEAKLAIDSGYDMYSIGLEVSHSSSALYTIENSQNKGYYPAESDQLEAVFEEIAQQIKKGITNAVVTDPIGEMFKLVKDGSYNGKNFEASHGTVDWDEPSETFTWNIGDIKENVDYFFKYKVTIDWDKNPEENVKYPMNGYTPLNYKDHNGEDKEKPFPIPEGEIELGSLTVKKVNENGEPLAGATFELRDSKNNLIATYTQIDDTTIKYDHLKLGSYTLIETKSPEGYRLLTKPINIEISKSNLHVTEVVKNSKSGWELPSTGGIGTALFYVLGLLLMGGAIILILLKKRNTDN